MFNFNLFNESSSQSLISYINKSVKRCAFRFPNRKWTFYVMTCYFNQDTAKILASNLKDILGKSFIGFHVLIDKDEWLKKCLSIDNSVEDICESTNLEKHQVSFTPINANGKLFHAKSYALISLPCEVETSNPKIVSDNLDLSQNPYTFYYLNRNHFPIDKRKVGFVIITSGNFAESGFNDNIEIGSLGSRDIVLCQYIKTFDEIKFKYTVSQEEITKEKEFQIAIKTLSLGTFYHNWDRSFDLRFRLKLSEKEINRLQNDSLKKNQERYGEYTPEERKTISLNPINIKSIFEQFPQPIPPFVWGIYSIETILGQWVPCEISDLIEEEIHTSIEICFQMIQELTSQQKMDEYVKKLQQDVNQFIANEVIEDKGDNLQAIDSWKEKVNKICSDKSILKLFICSYEKVDLSLKNLDRKTILDIFNRIKSFTNINKLNRGVSKTWDNLEINHNYKYSHNLFYDNLQQFKESLERNRREGINNIKPSEEFFATLKEENKLIHGIFVERVYIEKNLQYNFTYIDKNTTEKKSFPIQELRTFKIKKQIV